MTLWINETMSVIVNRQRRKGGPSKDLWGRRPWLRCLAHLWFSFDAGSVNEGENRSLALVVEKGGN